MTLSLDADLPTIRGELDSWAGALRSIGHLVGQIERVSVDPVDSPPAAARMVSDFEVLRRLAQSWPDDLRSELVATIPGGIQAYARSFRTHSEAALAALEGKDEVVARRRVRQELDLLGQALALQFDRARAVDVRLRQFLIALGQIVQSLKDSGDQAVAQVQLDERHLARILAELDELIGAAGSEKSRIDFLLLGEGSSGSEAVDVLAAINPVNTLVRLGYRIWTFFGGSDPAEEVRQRIEGLRRQRESMSRAQRRVAGLRLVHRQIEPLVEEGRDALAASGRIVNFWAVLETKLESVAIAVARSGATDLPALSRVHLNTGIRGWDQLAAYARSLTLP